MDWTNLVLWIHLLAGAAWLGEVVTINFVIFPFVTRLDIEQRRRIIKNLFPPIFNLASVLALITLTAGLLLNYLLTEWRDLDQYLSTSNGRAIFIGGLLGLLLTIFHFFAEKRLERRIDKLEGGSNEEVETITRYLRIIPRVGMVVIFIIFALMMYGARGL